MVKGAAITGETTQVPFYVYLRRSGSKVIIPGMERPDAKQTKIDTSEILRYAKPGDQLVIEPGQKRRRSCQKNFEITWRRLLKSDQSVLRSREEIKSDLRKDLR